MPVTTPNVLNTVPLPLKEVYMTETPVVFKQEGMRRVSINDVFMVLLTSLNTTFHVGIYQQAKITLRQSSLKIVCTAKHTKKKIAPFQAKKKKSGKNPLAMTFADSQKTVVAGQCFDSVIQDKSNNYRILEATTSVLIKANTTSYHKSNDEYPHFVIDQVSKVLRNQPLGMFLFERMARTFGFEWFSPLQKSVSAQKKK